MQNTTGWLLLIIAVSIVVRGELPNETVNYDTKTKAHEPEVLLKRTSKQISEAAVRRLQISIFV